MSGEEVVAATVRVPLSGEEVVAAAVMVQLSGEEVVAAVAVVAALHKCSKLKLRQDSRRQRLLGRGEPSRGQQTSRRRTKLPLGRQSRSKLRVLLGNSRDVGT